MILVTGGAGYIGSHTVLALLRQGYNVVVYDNLCNSSYESLHRVARISGRRFDFIEGDVRDARTLSKVFDDFEISCVIHFAGIKSVAESIQKPLKYYDFNVGGTNNLLTVMKEKGVNQLVFSSSATVYGEDASVPCIETMPHGKMTNPYGRSKAMIEDILLDLANSDESWSITVLRYFNPIGAHESGLIGEDPLGVPSNLMPYITQVAVGRLSHLPIFGNDYLTADGTCERDFIHVMDLANGHVLAVARQPKFGVDIFNLGTGKATSVMKMVREFERVTQIDIPTVLAEKRKGDLPQVWADVAKARELLGWEAQHTLAQMLEDAWRWQQKNPFGYRAASSEEGERN